MKTKKPTHTPGPWNAHDDNNPEYIDIDAGSQRITCLDLDAARQLENPPYPDAEVWANARLIAAAPDLLAVCGAILGAGLVECNCGTECDGTCTFSEIVRAVGKAEGR